MSAKLHTSAKALIIYGPRQVGKTTLMRQLVEGIDEPYLYVDADLAEYHDVLESRRV